MRVDLRHRLLATLHGAAHHDVASIPDLDAVLARWYDQASAAWPSVTVPSDVFLDYLAARIMEWADGTAALAAELQPSDLYLACACARGDSGAVALFEVTFRKDMDAVLSRSRASDETREDVRQIVLQKLFVAAPGKRPKIAEYQGRGELRKWVRMTVLRVFLDLQRRRARGREVELQDELLLAIPAHGVDPELAYLRTRYAGDLKECFKAAFGALSPRQRTLLRQHHLHGVGLEELAALNRVHRVTLARWLGKARAELVGATRTALGARLSITDSQLDSIIELVRSQLEVGSTD